MKSSFKYNHRIKRNDALSKTIEECFYADLVESEIRDLTARDATTFGPVLVEIS